MTGMNEERTIGNSVALVCERANDLRNAWAVDDRARMIAEASKLQELTENFLFYLKSKEDD